MSSRKESEILDVSNIQSIGDSEAPINPEDGSWNPYREVATEARDNLLRIMHNTANEKLSKEIAVEILDRAGETKHVEQRQAVQVKITNEQIELLVATEQEIIR